MNEKKTILIADDEEDTRNILELILSDSGYEVISSYDGLDAMDKVKSEHPNLVLLDIMMPLVDGMEVCRQIKSNEQTSDIKIIMLSASDESESIKKSRQSGADDYVTKPFDTSELLKRIEKLLSS